MQRKQIGYLHWIILAAAVIVTPSALLGQTDLDSNANQQMQQQQNQPSTRTSHPQNTSPDSNSVQGATGQEMKDKMFLRRTAEGGVAEVKMGNLAADKGNSDDVKSFGAKMVADHTMLSNSMKPIADSIGVRLPKDMNKMDQAEYDKLSALSGAAFDQQYITDMLKDHHKDLHEFHMEATATNDPALRDAAEKGEELIREHTRMIMKIAKEEGIAVPPPPGRPGGPPPPNP